MNERLKIGAVALAAAFVSTMAVAQSTSSSQTTASTTDSGISMRRAASAPGGGASTSAVLTGSSARTGGRSKAHPGRAATPLDAASASDSRPAGR